MRLLNTKGRTTATLVAAGTAVVLLLGVSNFWGDIVRFLQSDSDRIQGKRKVVSNGGGERFVTSFVFEGNTLTTTLPGSPVRHEKWSFRFDEEHRPGWFEMALDLSATNYFGEAVTSMGIYELNEDTLMICLNGSDARRPTVFEKKHPSDHLIVLKRE